MAQLPRVGPEKLKAQLHGMVDDLAEQIVQSMNAARVGHLIEDTEEPVRQAGREFVRAAFEAALQHKIDAAEASFSPSGERDDRSGDQASGEEADAQQRPPIPERADSQRSGQGAAPLVARPRGGEPGAGR